MSKFTGVITALVTPFQGGQLDEASFRRLLRQQLEQGVDGFVVNGTTGESPTLKLPEVRQLVEWVRQEAGTSKTLIVGTGSNSTEKTIETTQEVSRWGVDAALVVVPYYNRPPQRGLIKHFQAVAGASRIPIIAYNVPSRTVAALEPQTIAELSHTSNIVGIKEASGNMEMLADIQASMSKDFVLLSGDDASCVDFCARGGHGVISVSSHIIGQEMKSMILNHQDHEYRTRYADLMKWLYVEANPIPVKMALFWMKLLSSPELRLPLVELDERHHKDFQECLKKLAKI